MLLCSLVKNPYEIVDGVVKIEVWWKSLSLIAYVDEGDFAVVDSHKGLWTANPARAPKGKYYVNGKVWDAEKKRCRTVLMHRLIMGLVDPKVEVNHKDNNGLNNRRYNLEAVTHAENMRYLRRTLPHWREVDRKRAIASEYRRERKIAAIVAEQYELSRVGMWKIRVGQTISSLAATDYRMRCENAGVSTLQRLMAKYPQEGKWGIEK